MDVLIDRSQELLRTHGPNILFGIAILPIGWLIARISRRVVRRITTGARLDPTLAGFCANLLYIIVLAITVITALGVIGVPTVSFAAVVGAAGLAVGLALKGTLSNFAAGVLLIALRPFQVGDTIEAAGVSGTVERIQVFATTLKTPDNTRIIVPNASVTGGNIVNHSPAHSAAR